MSNSLEELIQDWTLGAYSRRPEDESYGQLLRFLEYLSEKFYCRYIPALYPPSRPIFLDRLFAWLKNSGVSKKDSQQLFKLATLIHFVSFEDFIELYRAAFTGPITRWIIDQERLSLADSDFQSKLDDSLRKKTWYCPVTDSMIISEFYHANRITGIDQRPAFRAMSEFGSPKALSDYMKHKGLTRLVLLEDFVGTGTQSIDRIKWALDKLNIPILFIPLIVCPKGAQALSQVADSNFRWEHLITVDDNTCVTHLNPDKMFKSMADLATRLHALVTPTPGLGDPTYGPFGFGSTGSLVVMFSNTPDNTLPLLHFRSNTWNPLFPRVSREV